MTCYAQPTYYAQPYNITVDGFFFEDYEEYETKAAALRDSFGYPVEEFEIQYISGNDGELFDACSISQGSLHLWFEQIIDLDIEQQAALFYLCNNGHSLTEALQKIDDVCLSTCSLSDAASEFFDECYLQDLPSAISMYIDYDAFARDQELNGYMSEFCYVGKTYTCTNATEY
ncbi:antirestriction protein ArdA [Glaciimonas soli]|uniref:Antirestriction protein ArdA n=1 Tax=Glaciimonas soli TaxID=2590999 RepID=A0A843YRF9_9BURK|nr:antirestriction protein ArdA [Glaciimonas soli]MQR02339.1 hypothetical protein [Glaciimonas soli]